jgi:uncharacterized protein YbbC (DUF1343 family)
VQAHITGADFRPLLAWVCVIREIRRLYADDFAWRPPHEVGARLWFDTLAGSPHLRAQIEADVPLAEIAAEWDAAAAAFRAEPDAYRLYS